MIYDTFLFYNELELLDIRLHELDSVVDEFVLVEATVTHTNKPKPLYYQRNKHLFKKFHKKIIHIIVDDSPDVYMPWIIERHQLSAVTRGLGKCKPDDTILYSCVDEIPKAEKILEWKDKPGDNKVFKHALSLYFLNCVRENGDIEGTRMFRFKDLKKFKDIYFTRYLKSDINILDGGWHFSYMGGIKKIKQKLAAFAHQELNNDKYNTPEGITRAIIEGKDPFGFGWKFKIKDISFLPQYVQKNRAKFEELLVDKSKIKKKDNGMNILILELRHKVRTVILRRIKKLYATVA